MDATSSKKRSMVLARDARSPAVVRMAGCTIRSPGSAAIPDSRRSREFRRALGIADSLMVPILDRDKSAIGDCRSRAIVRAHGSGTRVGVLVDVEQAFLGDVGIDLGRGQVAVAEQFLDAPEVGPAVEQVGREAVAQGVRAGAAVEAEGGEVALEQAADAPRRQPGPVAVEEDGRLAAAFRLPQAAASGRSRSRPSARSGRAARDAPCPGRGPAPVRGRGRRG